jgi:hypothetical protein
MLVIVANHYQENLDWLKKSKWPVVVINKEGADPTDLPVQYTIPNKGFETSGYLKYIVENYDNLPDHIAFLHGHEEAWHQFHDQGLLELIEGANIDKHQFIPLNNFMRWYPFADEGNPEIMDIVTYWDRIGFPIHMHPPHYFMLRVPIGAQFIVAKERILALPKEQWQHWYDAVMEDGTKKVALFFENVFHICFGEFWRMEMKDDWFKFETKAPMWFHEHTGDAMPVDEYTEILLKEMTMEELQSRIEPFGWRWN